MYRITKDIILEELKNARARGVTVNADLRDLKWTFGFKRVDGLEFQLRKIIAPNITEDQMSFCPPGELHQNIENWCEENKVSYRFDINEWYYEFR